MKGQITTASFFFDLRFSKKSANAPVVVEGVVVVVDNNGALVDPDFYTRRALRSIANPKKYELIKYELTGLDLGKTAYNIGPRSRPWKK